MNTGGTSVMPDFCNRRFPFHYATALNILTKLGVDINKVDLLAVGKYENYKGEIISQKPAPGTELEHNTEVVLEVGFSSAIDYMPYQFFYGLRGITPTDSSWERKARALMAPFDAAVVRHEAASEFEDLKNSFGFIEFDHLKKFLKIFDYTFDDDKINLDEAIIWSSLFPSFHDWAGNPDMVCEVLKYLFGYEFDIRENIYAGHNIPPRCRSHLGAPGDRLGKGLIIGRSFSDYDTGYEVVINGVKPGDMVEFLPGGSKREKIENVLEICMPSNLEHTIKIKAFEVKGQIGNTRGKSYLGYTSYI